MKSMALIEHTLFGTINKVEAALRRLKTFEPDEGYYLAFSGGKDSVVIKALADMAGVKYDAHYSVTGIDPPELVRFIRDQHPDVQWERAEKPFLVRMQHRGVPIRHGRWCCEEYKEAGGEKRLVLTGVRWAESGRRKKRMMVEACYNHPGKRFVHVIIDWKDEDVWQFIRDNSIPYCQLYDEGFKRLGCIACPMQNAEQKRKELDRWPAMERAFRHSFRKLYANRKAQENPSIDRWPDGDAMFDWWISNESAPKENDELGLFT